MLQFKAFTLSIFSCLIYFFIFALQFSFIENQGSDCCLHHLNASQRHLSSHPHTFTPPFSPPYTRTLTLLPLCRPADRDDALGSRGGVWAVRVGTVRPAHPAPQLPVRRHGEPLPHLCHPNPAGECLGGEGMGGREGGKGRWDRSIGMKNG